MSSPVRRLRGLAIALAVLAISAGVAFAGAPLVAPAVAPVAQEEPVPTEVPDAPEPTDAPDPTDAPEATEAPEDPGDETADTDTHGAMVSAAAQMETPEGFANHGAFVSCVAKMREQVDPATVTPELCAAADEARDAAKAEQKAERDAAKAEREAARDAAKAERRAAKPNGRP